MARYTQLKEKDIQKIAEDYSLDVIGFEPIEGGHGNSSYLLKTQDNKFVLTVFDDKPKKYVRRLAKLLRYLKKHGYATTRLIPPFEKEELITTYQEKPVMVKRFIPGRVRKELNPKMLRQMGKAMAQLHLIPAPDFILEKHPYGRQLFPSVWDVNIDPEYEAWLAEQTNYFENALPPGLPKGLIHGDLFYDNVLFEEKELQAVIDFEEACHYPFAFDIGMAMVGSCSQNSKIDLEKGSAFIGGYQAVRPLAKREKENLQWFVVYAATATSYWRFWKYNIHEPMVDKAKKHREMMRLAQTVRKIPTKDFSIIFM